MIVSLFGKEHKLKFSRYSNKNTSIIADIHEKGSSLRPISCNTLLKLKGKEFVALRDSKYMIDELINNKIIEDTYVGEVNESGNKMLIYRMTDWCLSNKEV